jgi:tetratricopeptide (TPR) repeat protein
MTDLKQLEKDSRHEQCVEHIRAHDYEKALGIALKLLDEDPEDAAALFQAAKCMLDQNRSGIAYNLMARAVKLRPDIPEMWLQYGQAHSETPEQWKKAEWCFNKAIQIGKRVGKDLKMAETCIGTIEYLRGNYDAALRHLAPMVDDNPDALTARSTKAFCHLAKHEWEQGWEYYESLLASKRRETYAYGDEPEWDGTPGKRLIISGEQGIGDEIMYASVFNDVLADNPHVVIECMPRLEKLFKRSFPDAANVYGTRWDNHVVWEEDHAPDAHVAMASLPRYYRTKTEQFPGTPYLTPDLDIVQAVKGIFSALGPNPKIGIGWTGGSDKTRGHLRTRTLEELTPLLRTPGVDWISLEYYNRDMEISQYYEDRKIPIHTYEWLTARGLDYDLTAGLISQLDLVISVPTTSIQVAGGLGIPAWCIVPRYTGWMFAQDTYPWASSVIPLHNPSMKELSERLEKWLLQNNMNAA